MEKNVPLSYRFSYQSICPPRIFTEKTYAFSDYWEQLKYLCGEGYEDRGGFQHRNDDHFRRSHFVEELELKRTPITSESHFRAYQEASYDDYHKAAENCYRNHASDRDRALFDGLSQEIRNSGISTSNDQILFHGRSDDDLSTKQPFSRFLSTSLDPVVGINSAFRRSFALPEAVSHTSATQFVYIVRTASGVPAIFGQYEDSHEWEFLFGPPLIFREDRRSIVGDFTIIDGRLANS